MKKDTNLKYPDGSIVYENDIFTTMKGNIPRTGKVYWYFNSFTDSWDWWFYSDENNFRELAKYAVQNKTLDNIKQ